MRPLSLCYFLKKVIERGPLVCKLSFFDPFGYSLLCLFSGATPRAFSAWSPRASPCWGVISASRHTLSASPAKHRQKWGRGQAGGRETRDPPLRNKRIHVSFFFYFFA